MSPSDSAGMAIDFKFINLLDQMKELDISEALASIIQE